jgi:2-iminobutanoate/2-iminopropanoate deaminase
VTKTSGPSHDEHSRRKAVLKMLNNPAFPPPIGYSHAVAATGIETLLFVSGQVGVMPDGSVPASVGEQAMAAIGNLNAMLAEGGMDASNIAKLTIYLTDESHLGEFMAAAGGTLPSPPPAVTLLIVKALAAPNLLIEIEAIATR